MMLKIIKLIIDKLDLIALNIINRIASSLSEVVYRKYGVTIKNKRTFNYLLFFV